MADDDSGDELVIDATSLLNLGEPDPVPEVVLPALPNTLDDIREDSNTPTGHLSTSQSEPTLPSANGVLETGSKALERKNSVLGDLSVFSEKGGKTLFNSFWEQALSGYEHQGSCETLGAKL